MLRELLWTPYREGKRIASIPTVERSSHNPGAITGLFFEVVISAAIIPALRRRVPGCVCERNMCSHPAVRGISRDPDLYVHHENRHAVFEFKVSPKKRDLVLAERKQSEYRDQGIGYFLIGGHAVAAAEHFARFDQHEWATFLSTTSKSHATERMTTIDRVIASAVEHLSSD